MPFRVGAQLPIHAAYPGGEIADVRRFARHAEQVGLDVVWAGDHLTTGFRLLESTVALTAAAAVTERLQIGYAVMLLALRQPAWAAKQIVSLQSSPATVCCSGWASGASTRPMNGRRPACRAVATPD